MPHPLVVELSACLEVLFKSVSEKIWNFFFCFEIICFWCFQIILMCWSQKWFLKNKKNIIDTLLRVKSTFKSNHNHTPKHPLKEPPMSPFTTVKFPNVRDKKNKHEKVSFWYHDKKIKSKRWYYFFVFIIKEIIFETIISFNLDYDNNFLFILIYHTNIEYKKILINI